MDPIKLKQLIKRYEDVYLFATKNISTMISEELSELSLEQFAVLRHLSLKGTMRATDLAGFFCVNKSAITAKIDRLVTRGFVERVRDDEDRRTVFIKITKEGEEAYLKGEGKIEEFVSSYLEELQEEEIESFLTIYEKILHIIDKRQKGRGKN
ncbi:MarR family transcriptional regulator [Cytobacillus spongiae]|uniref:MarR family winged helix-turn-helix transcriptional regulator n=1 Tax=Cytobacillus spongiae TaxID=2901381 RepID=UPI001F35DEB5|nr:MarR family transcriptional regulator [Cytobacillus spongiae]UII57216.1 MarR family transcriptional regulator [Cytobacillus spongiae]